MNLQAFAASTPESLRSKTPTRAKNHSNSTDWVHFHGRLNNHGASGGVELPSTFGGMNGSGHDREKGFEALHTLKTVTIKYGA
jgi:hypothetical protein